MTLTTGERAAAITSIKEASKITISTVAAGRILDAVLNPQTVVGSMVHAEYTEPATGEFGGYGVGL